MKKIVITGGNSGLGLEITKLFLEDNYNVVIIGKNEDSLKSVKNELNSDNLKTIQCDLRNNEEIEKNLESIKDIDILINNAGIIKYSSLEEHNSQSIIDIINTNLLGTILVTKKLLPQLKKSNSGIIMNVSSTSGLMTGGHANESIYMASKFGVTGFTESLKREMQEQKLNVKVLGFYPGGMQTQLFAKSGLEKDTSKFMDPKEIAKVMKFIIERPEGINMDHIVVNRNKAI